MNGQPTAAPQASKRLFKYVAGVLNGAFPTSQVSSCVNDVQAFLSTEDISFESACDALAVAIQDNHIPPQGVTVLKDLVVKPSAKAQAKVVSDRLREVLIPSENATETVLVLSENATDNVTTQDEATVEEDDGEHSPARGQRQFMSSHSKVRLWVSDISDAQLDSDFPLRNSLLGTGNANIDYILQETGVLLTLEEEDGYLCFAPASQDGKVTKQTLDRALGMAKDLIQDITTREHDRWLDEQKMTVSNKLGEKKEAIEPEEKADEQEKTAEQQAEEEEDTEGQAAAEAAAERERRSKENEANKPSRSNVNNLFRFVTSFLKDAQLPPQAYTTIKEIVASTEGCDIDEVEDVFLSASRLLAKSVYASEVPSQGMDVLQGLKMQMTQKGAEELCDSLEVLMRGICIKDQSS